MSPGGLGRSARVAHLQMATWARPRFHKVLAPAASVRSRVAQNKFLPKTRDYCTPLLLAVPHCRQLPIGVASRRFEPGFEPVFFAIGGLFARADGAKRLTAAERRP